MVINTWNERTPTCIRHTMLAWIVMNFERGAYWIAFSVSSARLLSSPSSLHSTGEQWFPETGENIIPWLQVLAGLTPSDEVRSTRVPSRKHRFAIIGERRHRWPRSWALVPSGTGGTGLIATFMAPRGRLMRGRWRRSKLSSLPSFCLSSLRGDLTNASESLGRWTLRWVKFRGKKRKIFPIEKIWRTMWKLLSILIPFVPFFGRKFWQMEICKFEEFGKFSNWWILVKILDYICD